MKSTRIKTGKVRFTFVNVFEPKPIGSSEPKFSVMVLIPKSDTVTINAVKDAMDTAVENALDKFKGVKPTALKYALKDGAEEYPDIDFYKDYYILNPSTDYLPKVVDTNKRVLKSEQEFYSGCYGKIMIKFYAYNNKGNKGVGCSFDNIIKLADGEKLNTRPSIDDDFADDFVDVGGDIPFN